MLANQEASEDNNFKKLLRLHSHVLECRISQEKGKLFLITSTCFLYIRVIPQFNSKIFWLFLLYT